MSKRHTQTLTPPERLERDMLQAFPDLDALTADMLTLKGQVGWPDWCYLPMSAAFAIVTGGADKAIAQRYIAATGMDTFRRLATVIPWRLAKVVYRFDPALTDELTRDDGNPLDAPVELLTRLPYPCVYIEHPPGLDNCDGVFAFLEWDERYPDAVELRLHYLFGDGALICIHHHYADNKTKLYQDMALNNARLARVIGDAIAEDGGDARYEACARASFAHINMLLYLCSEEPDVIRDAPQPRQRGRGAVKSAAWPDVVRVGGYIGSVIRAGNAPHEAHGDGPQGSGAPKRPHMRRAHWHLYWTGPGRTVPRIRWVMPVFVGGGDGRPDVSVHPVKE